MSQKDTTLFFMPPAAPVCTNCFRNHLYECYCWTCKSPILFCGVVIQNLEEIMQQNFNLQNERPLALQSKLLLGKKVLNSSVRYHAKYFITNWYSCPTEYLYWQVLSYYLFSNMSVHQNILPGARCIYFISDRVELMHTLRSYKNSSGENYSKWSYMPDIIFSLVNFLWLCTWFCMHSHNLCNPCWNILFLQD